MLLDGEHFGFVFFEEIVTTTPTFSNHHPDQASRSCQHGSKTLHQQKELQLAEGSDDGEHNLAIKYFKNNFIYDSFIFGCARSFAV